MAGETRSAALSASKLFYDNPGAGSFLAIFNLTFSTTENELNDVVEAGYIGPNVRVVAVGWYPSDMDSGTAAVHKVTVNAVDQITANTGAQTGVSSWTAVTPTAVATAPGTAPQLVSVTTTTAAGTAVAGTAVLVLLCQKI